MIHSCETVKKLLWVPEIFELHKGKLHLYKQTLTQFAVLLHYIYGASGSAFGDLPQTTSLLAPTYITEVSGVKCPAGTKIKMTTCLYVSEVYYWRSVQTTKLEHTHAPAQLLTFNFYLGLQMTVTEQTGIQKYMSATLTH